VLASQRDFGKSIISHEIFQLTRSVDWTSKQITYGLYLSDHSILNDVETEITVLSGIMIQNLPRETAWHLRGTRRIGVSMEDVETIQQCVSTPHIRLVYADAR
jgi:hypothetical protein